MLGSGFVLWAPVLTELPGAARLSALGRGGYLIVQSIVPSFLSIVWIFARHSLYPPYIHAGRVVGLSPLLDQQLAGFLAKLSTIAVLWTVAFVIMTRAQTAETRARTPSRSSGPTSSARSNAPSAARGAAVFQDLRQPGRRDHGRVRRAHGPIRRDPRPVGIACRSHMEEAWSARDVYLLTEGADGPIAVPHLTLTFRASDVALGTPDGEVVWDSPWGQLEEMSPVERSVLPDGRDGVVITVVERGVAASAPLRAGHRRHCCDQGLHQGRRRRGTACARHGPGLPSHAR